MPSNRVKKERKTLRRIEAMLEPRHLFILPEWAAPDDLDALMQQGYLRCSHEQRDEKGTLYLVMSLEVTEAGRDFLGEQIRWARVACGMELAGAALAVGSLAMLYVG